MSTTENLDSVVDRLYDAAMGDVDWPDFLRDLAMAFDADSAIIIDSDDNPPAWQHSACHGFDDELLPKMQALGPEDELTKRTSNWGQARPVSCRSVLSDDEVRGSRFYREFLQPAGLEYRLKLISSSDDRAYRCLAVMRDQQTGPFTETDVDRAAKLCPHVERALRIYRGHVRLEHERRAAIDTLNGLGIGVAVVEQAGTVHFMNDEAQDIMSRDDGFFLQEGRVRCSDPAADRMLALRIDHALSFDAVPPLDMDEPIAVGRKSGQASYALFVLPLPDGHVAWTADPPLASLFITDPQRPVKLPSSTLQRLYGLTGSESRLLRRFVAGASVSELATEFGITTNTVRAHLKNIFRATSTHSQAELIRRVMLDVSWMRTDDAPPAAPLVPVS